MTATDHGQDVGQDVIRLEISPPERYTRARAYVDEPVPPGSGPTILRIDRATVPAPAVVAEIDDPPVAGADTPPAQPAKRRKRYPLRRRGANTRAAKREAYRAAPTLQSELAVATDYARSVATTADQWGMASDPGADATAAIRDARDALMAVGDALTTAMHTWSPEP